MYKLRGHENGSGRKERISIPGKGHSTSKGLEGGWSESAVGVRCVRRVTVLSGSLTIWL